MACTFLISNRLDLCHPAELPEKAGLDETQIHVIEDQKFNSEAEALAACAKIEDGPRFIVAQALMPVIPAATLKAIEKFKASLPTLRDKLKALLQEDPETGEPTWRQPIEAEIIERTKKRVCPFALASLFGLVLITASILGCAGFRPPHTCEEVTAMLRMNEPRHHEETSPFGINFNALPRLGPTTYQEMVGVLGETNERWYSPDHTSIQCVWHVRGDRKEHPGGFILKLTFAVQPGQFATFEKWPLVKKECIQQ